LLVVAPTDGVALSISQLTVPHAGAGDNVAVKVSDVVETDGFALDEMTIAGAVDVPPPPRPPPPRPPPPDGVPESTAADTSFDGAD
jgi:hypothetical protein